MSKRSMEWKQIEEMNEWNIFLNREMGDQTKKMWTQDKKQRMHKTRQKKRMETRVVNVENKEEVRTTEMRTGEAQTVWTKIQSKEDMSLKMTYIKHDFDTKKSENKQQEY